MPAAPRRPRPLPRAGDRGSVTVIAAAITFPAVLLLLSACFQTAFWYAARSTALAAAQQGADTARADGATLAGGQAAACAFAARAAAGTLRDPACTAAGTPATVAVTVCGDAISLLPLLPARTCEQAQDPRERFTTAGTAS